MDCLNIKDGLWLRRRYESCFTLLNHCSVATALVNMCVCMFLHVYTTVRLYARKVDLLLAQGQYPVFEAAELIEPHILSLVRLHFSLIYTFVFSSNTYACFFWVVQPSMLPATSYVYRDSCPRDQA